MKTITIKGHVYAERNYDGTLRTYVIPYPPEIAKKNWVVHLGAIEQQYDLHGEIDFDAEQTRARIAALIAEREEAGREFSVTVKRIDDELRKLTAIEHMEAT